MTPPDLLDLMQEFYKDLLQLVLARQMNARSVTEYDANNGYQQVLGRQDVHLQWIRDAITSLGGSTADPPGGDAAGTAEKREPTPQILDRDAQAQRAFLSRWQPCLPAVTNARHRKMLELILGEMMEHLRVFQQAVDGRTDVLGSHARGKVQSGGVLSARPTG